MELTFSIGAVLMTFILFCNIVEGYTRAAHGKNKCKAEKKVIKDLYQQFTAVTERLNIIENALDELQFKPGPTYVRWGKTSCSSPSEKVYEGRMAGAGFDSTGSGSNYLCLPTTPEYADGLSTSPVNHRGEIFGAEYTNDNSGIPFSTDGANKDIPCVVCQTIGKTSVLMVPAKRTCLTGWTTEYVGFLVSEYKSNGRTPKSYECLDEAPDFIDGIDDNGAVIYPVQGRAISLPNYEDYKELSCVVCSK